MSLWLKIGLVAAALVVVAGIYAGWTYHQREIGRQEIIAKDAKAIAEQAVKDRKLSADLVVDLQSKLATREATVQPVREVIRRVVTPCSTATGPDVDAAAKWMRDALSETGGPPARR